MNLSTNSREFDQPTKEQIQVNEIINRANHGEAVALGAGLSLLNDGMGYVIRSAGSWGRRIRTEGLKETLLTILSEVEMQKRLADYARENGNTGLGREAREVADSTGLSITTLIDSL